MDESIIGDLKERLDKLYVRHTDFIGILDSITESESRLLVDQSYLGELFTDLKSPWAASCGMARKDVTARIEKINNIVKILSNKEIQIVFIGMVSSGKSKVINAIIEEKIFMSSTAATTTGIVELSVGKGDGSSLVHGSKESQFYDERKDLIEEILQLSTTLGDNPKVNNATLCVNLSHPKGSVLDDRIKLIDTPGCNSSDQVKSNILNVCQVADIVVYVMTYNFNDDERSILDSLSNKTSELNIFILVNKWDESDMDKVDSTEKSKRAIENNLIKWLTENKDTNEELAKARLFFISAKERVDIVTNDASGKTVTQNDNAIFRDKQFNDFIQKLKTVIDNPEYCKCLKHKKDIDQIEGKITGDVQQWLQLTKEIMDKRRKSLKLIESVHKNLEINKAEIVKYLSDTKEKKLEFLNNSPNENSRIFSFIKELWYQVRLRWYEVLKFDKLVHKIDDELKKVEEVGEGNLRRIVSHAISNESRDINIQNYTLNLHEDCNQLQQKDNDQNQPDKKNQKSETNDTQQEKKPDKKNQKSETNDTQQEKKPDKKNQKSETNDTQQEKKNTYIEKEKITKLCQVFEETVSNRIDPLLNSMETLLSNIKKSIDDLQVDHEKLANFKHLI